MFREKCPRQRSSTSTYRSSTKKASSCGRWQSDRGKKDQGEGVFGVLQPGTGAGRRSSVVKGVASIRNAPCELERPSNSSGLDAQKN